MLFDQVYLTKHSADHYFWFYGLLAAFLLTIVPVLGYGQEKGPSQHDYEKRIVQVLTSNQNIGNQSFIEQVGNLNDALVRQSNSGNSTSLYQIGDYQSASLITSGSENIISAHQDGIRNDMVISLSGKNNDLMLLQRGAGNSLSQNFRNIRNLDLKVTQEGTNNFLEISEKNFNASRYRPISISQTGGARARLTIGSAINMVTPSSGGGN